MSSHTYNQELIATLAAQIKAAGLRVFIAESGTYGFFTDDDGARVISFQSDLTLSFSGNYRGLDGARGIGTGWRISDEDTGNYVQMLESMPPRWAVGDARWLHTNMDEHLATYQKSSRYTEVL